MFRAPFVSIMIGVVLLVIAGTAAPTAAQSHRQCFPKTGYALEGYCLRYWHTNVGMPPFGDPLSPAHVETTPTAPRRQRPTLLSAAVCAAASVAHQRAKVS